jgi:hypothetical protein
MNAHAFMNGAMKDVGLAQMRASTENSERDSTR